ncbi:MAG: EAL domain-containing protein [Chromatiales bacterium]|nr:EAL domain-containing protein [Chromatiales bacterium]
MADPQNPADSLAAGLEHEQLLLQYQPVFDIRKSDPLLLTAEALVRWSHPDRGLLPPGEFLPLASRNGLMPAVTDFVFQRAVEQLFAWQQRGIRLPLAVNIAGHLLRDRGFPARLLRLLDEYGIPPERMILELSEQGAMVTVPATLDILQELMACGFPLVIDDFGKGSISLVQLLRLPFVGLKVDQELVQQIGRDDRAKQLVRGIVHMAHDLGMAVCAEGVEDRETLFLLKGLGCDSAQGWLLGAPAGAADLPLAGSGEGPVGAVSDALARQPEGRWAAPGL